MEYFDVVNDIDEIIGKASRDEVHEKHLAHRAATVWIFNSNNELYMAQRSRHKDKNPLKWQASASGHVDAGETYEHAAQRELEEECSIKTPIKYEFGVKVFSEEQKEFFKLYTTHYDGEIELNEEFEQARFMSLEDVRKMIKEDPSQFRDAFLIMFEKYFS